MERFNETQVLEIKAAISAAAAALSAWLGWFGWLAVIYLACMVVDYITGSAAAGKSGVWSSAAAREGIWHKAGSIVAVAASLLTDILIGLVVNHLPAISLPFQYTVLFCPVVIVWYILTELKRRCDGSAHPCVFTEADPGLQKFRRRGGRPPDGRRERRKEVIA